MFHQLKTFFFSSVILIALFFLPTILFSLLFSGFLIYFGGKKFHRFLGKILFGLGLFFVVLIISNVFMVKVLLIILVFYYVHAYVGSKKKPKVHSPLISYPNENVKVDTLVLKRQQLLSNKWIGHQQTPNETYEWEDIQLQNGVGDVVIDLSNTVLPLGESIISIRGGIGKVTILIPYEIDISLRHSVIIGSASVFHFMQTRMWNESMHYTTQEYNVAPQKMKILTSMWIGDLEVKRV